jgi:hypothetical protein
VGTQPRNPHHSGAQGVIVLEGSSATSVEAVEGVVQPAGCSTTARAQEDGAVIWEAPPVLHVRCEVAVNEGKHSSPSKQNGESEGRIGAMTSGNVWHADPGEQRRPVRM